MSAASRNPDSGRTVNMLFELLFIAGVLTTACTLIAIVVTSLRGNRMRALRIAQVLGGSWLVYLAVVVLVAASTRQRVLRPDENLCFDEMCFSVVDVHRSNRLGPQDQSTKANGVFYVITIKVQSRARRRAQRENGIYARLWAAGKYFEKSASGEQAYVSERGPTANLTERLRPGESVESVQVFDVPPGVSGLGLVLDHGLTPGYLVIGESPILHNPTVIQLN
jgi:hypothetical protein